MPIYDISLTISNDLPVWPGDTPIDLVRNKDMRNGELYTLSQITTTVHVGSHLDAPMHFVRDGYGVDQIDLNKLIGPCFVVDLPNVSSIDAQSLEQANIPVNVTRLLCRTRNSQIWARGDKVFHTDFVAIHPTGAEWIVQRGIQLVGVDYLSVGAYEGGIPTHEILLSHGVVPVEGLDLSRIEPGEYQLICLPLKLKDCDGAPVRAVLIRGE
ncbi:MAG TPA: cyclase family protein [Anaerolineae bacterium]|nr:cyclase family protein [Anaerolineae bacterium]